MIGMFPGKFRASMKTIALLLLLALVLESGAMAASAPQKPSITAASAIVMDYDTGEVLYEKDADTMRVPASMTKVMTAYIIFEELEAGNLTLDTMVPISSTNAQHSRDGANYPTSVPLPAGGKVSVDMLLRLILIPSASASCIVMAEYISGTEAAFVQRMNETAKRLGMTAEYKNSHGAHVHYLTARSQAILVRSFIQRFPQILNYTSLTGVTFNGKWYSNTNKLLPGMTYAYDGVDGFKTGTISAAGYCLSATAVKNGRRIISVVMRSSNDCTRHTDSRALLDYGFAMLEYQAPYSDVAYHWCREDVAELKDLGVELHTSGELFRPDAQVTRAEFAAMLYTALERSGALPEAPEPTPAPTPTPTPTPEATAAPITTAVPEETPESTTEPESPEATAVPEESPAATTAPQESEPPAAEEAENPTSNAEVPGFADIQGHWAQSYIEKSAQLGLVSGVTDTTFAPDRTITRQEMMVMIDRVLELPDVNGLGFTDDGDIAIWALNSAARTTGAGIFQGSGGKLLPKAAATRAEAAAVLAEVLDYAA